MPVPAGSTLKRGRWRRSIESAAAPEFHSAARAGFGAPAIQVPSAEMLASQHYDKAIVLCSAPTSRECWSIPHFGRLCGAVSIQEANETATASGLVNGAPGQFISKLNASCRTAGPKDEKIITGLLPGYGKCSMEEPQQ